MEEKEIEIAPLSLSFQVKENEQTIRIPKSQTQISYPEQLNLISGLSSSFVPLSVQEQEDAYLFQFLIDPQLKKWQSVKKLRKNEKLRVLCNLESIHQLLSTRVTFFLHPNNIVFDDNLLPKIIYRGVRGLVAPFEMNENDLLKQIQCFSIALFSDTYTFDNLYQGSLEKAGTTPFERQVKEQKTIHDLFTFLQESYVKEQKEMERKMTLVPNKRFKLYKQLTIWLSVVTVLILSLLIYTTFIKVPYQDRLLQAQKAFLTNEYGEVINTLHQEDMEKLPSQSKYILAYSYVKVEQLTDEEKEAIMKNISMKSDSTYLMYWIYNGLGDFDKSIDLAKYMDDPQLIMYGLIKKTEQVKNDPELTGSEREEEINQLRSELEKYTEEYELLDEEAEETQSKLQDEQQNIEDKETENKEKAKSTSEKEKTDKK